MQKIFATRMHGMRGRFVWGLPGGRRRTSLLVGAVAAIAMASPGAIGAQAPAATHQAIAGSSPHAAQGKKRSTRAKAVAAKTAQKPEAPAPPPPPPPPPNWPVNDPPAKASVEWNAQGLSIDAKNSSLQEILKEISEQTGAKIEGMSQDQRVFGVYGPGQPREVLSDLLEGSGYNVLMVGNAARGVPQHIELSERPKGGPQPNAPVSPGEMYEPPVAPYQPPEPIVRPNNQPQPPRTPQQILQEMQQRQQQLREEQMRQQQQGQPPQEEQQQQEQ
ncbi:MAG TPA: hypothetical protein VF730_07830 [Terracidiphilus sp.]